MTTPADSPTAPQRDVAAPSTRRAANRPGPRQRSSLRSVALPSEHGGWGLTAEPVVLGLLVAPSWAGLALGLAAVVAFLSRTPLKVALVDLRRGRRLDRTRLAAAVALVELVLLAGLVAVGIALADGAFWPPLLVAAPLIAVELAYDIRSRSRRLVPELAGSIGIASAAAVVVLADGAPTRVAVGAWAVLAARALTSIPHVRSQVRRLHGRPDPTGALIAWDAVALVVAVGAVALDPVLVGGAIAIALVVALQRLGALRPAPTAVRLGMRQSFLGVGVVAATWIGTVVAGGIG